MEITALSSQVAAMHTARTPETAEGPGPDHDGDADDKSVVNAQANGTSSLTPKWMGVKVDAKA